MFISIAQYIHDAALLSECSASTGTLPRLCVQVGENKSSKGYLPLLVDTM
jgi:hypothetical protein